MKRLTPVGPVHRIPTMSERSQVPNGSKYFEVEFTGRSVARFIAPALGAGGRRFESCRPDVENSGDNEYPGLFIVNCSLLI